MRRTLLAALALGSACIQPAAAKGDALDDFLGNWMGELLPVIGNGTILDLSMPGAHDTVTYDLSTSLSDGYEGMPDAISKILHALTPLVAGEFIRSQGQTQGINITAMLDSGVRFIDFRIMYTGVLGQLNPDKKDWYGLHGCQTQHTSMEYLQQVRAWMDRHPKELLVFWLSRHGSTCLNKGQYPATPTAAQQGFFGDIEKLFDGMLIDSSQGLVNETSINTYLSRGQRMLLYTGNYAEFTGSSPKAVDACQIDNHLGASDEQHPDNKNTLVYFRDAKAVKAADKPKNSFYLLSMAESGPTVGYAAEIRYLDIIPIDRSGILKNCAKEFSIPNMTSDAACGHAGCWCPIALADCGLLANYYNQLRLDIAYSRLLAGDGNWDFPNAIYIDGIDTRGTIHTGPGRIAGNVPAGSPLAPNGAGAPNQDARYAYAATVIGANVQRFCRLAPANPACAGLNATVNALRAEAPLQQWDDPARGRVKGWPTLFPM